MWPRLLEPPHDYFDLRPARTERAGGLFLAAGGDRGGGRERDVLSRVVAAGVEPKTTPVKAVMTRDPVTVPSSTTVEEVMTLFTNRRFRHLPVVDAGRLVGLVSIDQRGLQQ